jgi:uncharacterized repeat protein (TIGR01451 family)
MPTRAYLYQIDPCATISFPYTLTGATNAERVANLNKAIDCANSNSTSDVIDLDGQSLILSEVADTFDGYNCLKVIRSDITIRNGELIREPNDLISRLLYVVPGAHLQLDNVTLRNGGHASSIFEGGAIHNNGMLTVNNSTFTGNSSSYGGAIYNRTGATLYLNNSVLSGNFAYYQGGAIRSRGVLYINNSTIAGNYARLSGGGISISSGSAVINNSIVAGNTASSDLNLQGSYSGSHNLVDVDAEFINLVKATSSGATNEGDYHLRAHSPAIDAGSNSLVPGGLTIDRDGEPRFVDDGGVVDTGEGSAPIVDIGAYERQTDSPIVTVDLSVYKTVGQSSVIVGDVLTYNITVANIGAHPVLNATIEDSLPTALNNATWIAVGAGGATPGASSGTGDIVDVAILPVGGSITYTINAEVDPSASTGTLVNTARIRLPKGYVDSDPSNDQSSVSVMVLPVPTATPTPTPTPTPTVMPQRKQYLSWVQRPAMADLVASIKLVPNKTSFAAGEAVEVIVTVTNQGDAPAQGFWVDLFINPSTAPNAANVLWHQLCSLEPCFGMAWEVTQTLAPGQTITLSSNQLSGNYSVWPGWFAAGTTDLYAYVDSYNADSASGTVLESNEANNRAELRGLRVSRPNPVLKLASLGKPKDTR